MNFRTDLALEKRENLSSCEVDGVISKREERKGVAVTTITVTNENGAKALGKSRRFIRRRIRTVNIVSIAEYPEQLAVSGIAGVHMQ